MISRFSFIIIFLCFFFYLCFLSIFAVVAANSFSVVVPNDLNVSHHQLTVSHQRAFSLPITTTACSASNESNIHIRSSTQLTDMPPKPSSLSNNNQNNIKVLTNRSHAYHAMDADTNSTFVTKSNHINCFHQRTRSLPLTEEETIAEIQFHQLPSVSSSSSSSLLHPATNAMHRLTNANSCVSSLSSMHSSSNSSITTNGVDLNGSSILRKLCENLCTQKTPDGNRKHQPKCCFYNSTEQSMHTKLSSAASKKDRSINKTHHFHQCHLHPKIINHKQCDNFNNSLPSQNNAAANLNKGNCNNMTNSNNHHIHHFNNNNNNLDATNNDSAYLLMTSTQPINRKGMNNSMDCIDENNILAIEHVSNTIPNNNHFDEHINNYNNNCKNNNRNNQNWFDVTATNPTTSATTATTTTNTTTQSNITSTANISTTIKQISKTNPKFGVVATKNVPTIVINSATTTVGRTIAIKSMVTHTSSTDHNHCTNSLAILTSSSVKPTKCINSNGLPFYKICQQTKNSFPSFFSLQKKNRFRI